MSKSELVDRLMQCRNLSLLLDYTVTKGELQNLDVKQLRKLLDLYDKAQNVRYEMQSLVFRS